MASQPGRGYAFTGAKKGPPPRSIDAARRMFPSMARWIDLFFHCRARSLHLWQSRWYVVGRPGTYNGNFGLSIVANGCWDWVMSVAIGGA